jgi:Na+/H+ antiporter NhaD/arsenite permease-like protein/uncharacterized membrane protein (UPF0127 family)
MLTALIIFLFTYVFIGLRQIPRLHIDRTAGALVGAVLMIVSGVVTLDQAFAAIDMRTLLLLLGMMIITVYLRTAGFFELMAEKIMLHSRTPFQLLVFVSLTSGLLSALFVNDTICLLYTPIILEAAVQLRVSPMPYLLALATSSNIGSVMTVTGNPQNMLIGVTSRIGYLPFLLYLFPVALIGLAVCIVVIRFFYRREMSADAFSASPHILPYPVDKVLLVKALSVCGGVLLTFSLGYPYSLAAIAGATVLLLFGRVRTESILDGVDWMLLLFFSGLFVVMRGVESSGLAGAIMDAVGNLGTSALGGKIAGLTAVTAILSNVVSNVPAVMLLKPFVATLGNGPFGWLTLAMSSTLAGNLTLVGSVANLIVVQQARRRIEIGFMDYFRVGAVITAITLVIGVIVLSVEARVAGASEAVAAERSARRITFYPRYGVDGQKKFHVVLVCDTGGSRVKGLQGFRPLERDEAALFVFQKPEEVTFWMGSVSFPIDIIFIDPTKTVVAVSANCMPGSREYYPSHRKILWVVETAAGSHVQAGDRVRFE